MRRAVTGDSSADLPIAVHAGRLWAFRARAELGAAARFRRIAHGLSAIGSARPLVDLAHRSADDEMRHHVRCVDLARRFDAEARTCREPEARPLNTGSNDLPGQILHELVAMSCVTESLSTALLVRMREGATDRGVAEVVQEVLRDEVRHARLGWAHLAASKSAPTLAALGARLPSILADTVDEELFSAAPDPVDAPDLVGLGGLGRAERCATFTTTMEAVVFPGLRRYGIDTRFGEHWLAERRRSMV